MLWAFAAAIPPLEFYHADTPKYKTHISIPKVIKHGISGKDST